MIVRLTTGQVLDLPPDDAAALIERGDATPVRTDQEQETPEQREQLEMRTICD